MDNNDDNLLNAIAGAIDMALVRQCTLKLHELERSTSNSAFKASTDYVMELMHEAGLSDIERYPLPCDGTTTFGDCTMPEAWDCIGRCHLEVVSPEFPETERILADTDTEPLNASIWSIPTPPEGITAQLIALKDLPENDFSRAKGKIVLCNFAPAGETIHGLASAGAVGLVSFSRNCLESNPDDVQWMNGPGRFGWYYATGDHRLWNFSITPRRGAMVEQRLDSGEEILLHAVMNTRVYNGTTYTVTGLLPGRSTQEIALLAHMYEPFLPDNSAGVALTISAAKALRDLSRSGTIPELEKGIRVIFSMERYGFSVWFHNRNRSRAIIAAFNMDMVCLPTFRFAGIPLELRHSSAAVPFFGEILLRNRFRKSFPLLPLQETAGILSGDTFGADLPFNIPTNWLFTPAKPGCQHNSGKIFSCPDWEVAECVVKTVAETVGRLATVRCGQEAQAMLAEIRKGVAADASSDFQRLNGTLSDGAIHPCAAQIVGDFLKNYHAKRLLAINAFCPKTVSQAQTMEIIEQIAQKHPAEISADGVVPLSSDEMCASRLVIVRDLSAGLPMSLARIPENERKRLPAAPPPLLIALLDGSRSLFDAASIAGFMLRQTFHGNDLREWMDYFRRLAEYGYFKLR